MKQIELSEKELELFSIVQNFDDNNSFTKNQNILETPDERRL